MSTISQPYWRWRFRDVHRTGPPPYEWVFEVNPNEGGSPKVEKQITQHTNTGPMRGVILQEGQSSAPTLDFSGVILTQSHYESLEVWYEKRVLLELIDDLGRTFQGIFSAFTPSRIRRASNPWYHQYQASFTCYAYRSASGIEVYGRMTGPFTNVPA